jgi:hypothetical protein
MHRSKDFYVLLFVTVLSSLSYSVSAQIDTTKKSDTTKRLTIEEIIARQKGFIRQLAQNLLHDTAMENVQALTRTDQKFQRYKGKIIRQITVQSLEFGAAVSDTSNRLKNSLRNISNSLHHRTREVVIRNNLFFSENEKLSPYILADNEKHLRDLPFIRDAIIRVLPVRGTRDSVDVSVISKDVLSIGGTFKVYNAESVSVGLKEDNFFGNGDRIVGETLFDMSRDQKFGYDLEYIKRNIAGSFVDAALGFSNFNKTFNYGKREERLAYLRLAKPLVSRNMLWTYGSELEYHETQNFYHPDSIYRYFLKYKYNLVDAWGMVNLDASKADNNDYKARLRRLVGLRVIHQNFMDEPGKYANQYFYNYADLTAVLGSMSVFRQAFYKTQYIYGFGRNEDVPEGMEASLTSGWTKKDGRARPFAGINFQKYYFTPAKHYLNFTVKAGAYLYKNATEDVDLLARVDYFSRLIHPEGRWKQRFFFSTSVTKQINRLLNEPLALENEYGFLHLENTNVIGGDTRFMVKGETVFFSPWSVLFFRFAPFVYGDASYLNYKTENHTYIPKLYTAVGGGIRIRNESLIFGTTEFRGTYFPRKNLSNESWRFEVSTNIRFKYNQEFVRRPEFVKVN